MKPPKRTTHFELIRHSMDVKLGYTKSVEEILAEKWHQEFFNKIYTGMEKKYDQKKGLNYWSEFTTLMKNRLIFGEFRYGNICPTNCAAHYSDYVKYAQQAIDDFFCDRNLEHFVDVANCWYLIWSTHGFSGCLLKVESCYLLYVQEKGNGHKLKTQHNKTTDKRLQRKQ